MGQKKGLAIFGDEEKISQIVNVVDVPYGWTACERTRVGVRQVPQQCIVDAQLFCHRRQCILYD